MLSKLRSTGGSLLALVADLYQSTKGQTEVATHLIKKPFNSTETVGESEGAGQNLQFSPLKNRHPPVEQANLVTKPRIVGTIKKGIAKAKTKAATPVEGDR